MKGGSLSLSLCFWLEIKTSHQKVCAPKETTACNNFFHEFRLTRVAINKKDWTDPSPYQKPTTVYVAGWTRVCHPSGVNSIQRLFDISLQVGVSFPPPHQLMYKPHRIRRAQGKTFFSIKNDWCLSRQDTARMLAMPGNLSIHVSDQCSHHFLLSPSRQKKHLTDTSKPLPHSVLALTGLLLFI